MRSLNDLNDRTIMYYEKNSNLRRGLKLESIINVTDCWKNVVYCRAAICPKQKHRAPCRHRWI